MIFKALLKTRNKTTHLARTKMEKNCNDENEKKYDKLHELKMY